MMEMTAIRIVVRKLMDECDVYKIYDAYRLPRPKASSWG